MIASLNAELREAESLQTCGMRHRLCGMTARASETSGAVGGRRGPSGAVGGGAPPASAPLVASAPLLASAPSAVVACEELVIGPMVISFDAASDRLIAGDKRSGRQRAAALLPQSESPTPSGSETHS